MDMEQTPRKLPRRSFETLLTQHAFSFHASDWHKRRNGYSVDSGNEHLRSCQIEEL